MLQKLKYDYPPVPRTQVKAPFLWSERRIVTFLGYCYFKNKKKLTTALAIYFVLCDYAANVNSSQKEGWFYAYYSDIAKKVGKSPRTIARYCDEFIKLGLLQKKSRRRENQRLANTWRLLELSPIVYASKQDESKSGHNDDHTL